jgi:hypothetical protein
VNPKDAVVNLVTSFIIFITVFIALSLLIHKEACAQVIMAEYPKRFSFSGLAELTYSDYYYQFPSRGGQRAYHVSFFRQTYGLTMQGYIYHPRLAVFSATVSYNDERELTAPSGKTNSHDIGYNIRLTLLPYRPISLDLYANDTYYTISPTGSFINPEWANTQNLNYRYYGARLKINKPFLPIIILEYTHEEDDLLGLGKSAGTLKSDDITLDFRGSMRFWETTYQGLLQYEDFSSPSVRYKSKIIQLNSISTPAKGITLQNSFNYSDIDYYKLLTFNSQLNIARNERFNQYYSYLFYKSETNFKGILSQGFPGQTSKKTINSGTGSWTYRFVAGPIISLSLNYGLRKEDSDKGDFYGINLSTSYSRSFLGLNFSPRYTLLIRHDKISGKLLEHDIELDLMTKNLHFGTIYSNYSLTITKEEDMYRTVADETGFVSGGFETNVTKIDNVIQLLRAGVRGRLGKILSRAQWNVEAQVLYSNGTIERQNPGFFFDGLSPFTSPTLTSERNVRSYTLRGNISYPVGWVTIFFNTNYSLGQSNGQNFSRFFYEERINYPILRNLYAWVRWKQVWDKVSGNPTQRTDEYDLSAEYRLGQSTIGLYGTVLRSMVSSREIYLSTVFLKFRRRFF